MRITRKAGKRMACWLWRRLGFDSLRLLDEISQAFHYHSATTCSREQVHTGWYHRPANRHQSNTLHRHHAYLHSEPPSSGQGDACLRRHLKRVLWAVNQTLHQTDRNWFSHRWRDWLLRDPTEEQPQDSSLKWLRIEMQFGGSKPTSVAVFSLARCWDWFESRLRAKTSEFEYSWCVRRHRR